MDDDDDVQADSPPNFVEEIDVSELKVIEVSSVINNVSWSIKSDINSYIRFRLIALSGVCYCLEIFMFR